MKTLQLICQLAAICLFVLAFFATVKIDIEGRHEKKPLGFRGVIATIVAYSVTFAIWYLAGAFSLIFPKWN